MTFVRSLALLLLAPLLLLAACGSDSSTDPGPYVDAVRDDIEDGEAFSLEGDAAQCVAEALVDAADAETLDDAGVTPEEFAAAESFDDVDADFDDDELRSSLTDALGGCSLGEPLTDVFLSEFPFEVDEDDRGCISTSLDDGDELSDGLADTLVDGTDQGIQDAFASALTDCPAMTGEILTQALGQAGLTVSEDAQACLVSEIETRGETAVDQLLAGGAEAQGLGEELGLACLPELSE